MLIALAIHSTRIAIAASPAPRNTALIRNSIMITPLAPSMIVVNAALATTAGDAPMNRSKAGAYATPNTPTGTATSTPSSDRLHGGACGAVAVLFPDPSGDDRHRADAQAPSRPRR